MKELIDKLLVAIPAYARQMIDLLRNPREFVKKLDLASDSVLPDALTFLAISFALAFIAQLPMLSEKQNKEIMFGVSAIQAALAFAVSVAFLAAAWKIVGGKLSFKKFLIVTCYFSGVSTLLFLMVTLIAWGVFRSLDPALPQQMLKGVMPDHVDLMKSTGYQAFWALFGVGFVVTFVWIFHIWSGYRELNQVSRTRSAIAFAIYLLLSPLAIGLQFPMASSLSSSAPAAFPSELAGQWKFLKDQHLPGSATHHAVMFSFDSNGYYNTLESRGTTNGRCYNLINDGSYGHASAHGSTLTLHLGKHTESTDNTCNGTKLEAPKELDNVVYQYVLCQNPDGQELCLNGRFGETCLRPEKR